MNCEMSLFYICLLLDEKKEKFMKQVKELEEGIEKYKSDAGTLKKISLSAFLTIFPCKRNIEGKGTTSKTKRRRN